MGLLFKILGATFVPFLATVILYHTFSTSEFSRHMNQVFQQQASNRLSQAETDIRQFLNSREAKLKMLATLSPPDAKSHEKSQQTLYTFLQNQESFFNVSAINFNGQEWIRANKFTESLKKNTITNLFSSPIYQQPMLKFTSYFGKFEWQQDFPLPFLDISVPIKNLETGDIAGIIWGKLSFQHVQTILERYLPEYGKIMLIDNIDGKKLLQADDTKKDFDPIEQESLLHILQAKDNAGSLRKELNGETVSILYRKFSYKNLPFVLVYYQPDEIIFFLTNQLKIYNFYLTIAGIVIFVVTSFFFVHRVINPLCVLTQKIKKLGDKYQPCTNCNEGSKYPTSGDEIQQLHLSFNSFEAQLSNYNHEIETFNKTLEHQVADKTKKLAKVNEALEKDIIRRQEVEKDLERHKRDLEETVRSRTAELSLMNQELQNEIEIRKKVDGANRAKSLFLANMSHEIRTPINAIIGMNNLALETKLDKKQKRYLEVVQTSSKALLNIINDILDLSKIEADQIDLEERPFSLRKACQATFDNFTIELKKKNIQFNFNLSNELPEILVGDELRLGQVLINLLGNAVKFTKKGSITVAVEKNQESKTEIELEFCIQDTGPGIPEAAKQKIFDSFTQADTSMTRVYGGTGLGLFICKKLIKLLGGEIWVESEGGQGSSFYFTVNFRKDADNSKGVKPTALTSEKISRFNNANILLVEDNHFNMELAKTVLENEGHHVITALNGIVALEVLEQQYDNIDIIIMDVQMPKMDGITATKIIRRCERQLDIDYPDHMELIQSLYNKLSGTRIPIIAMTAHAMAGDRKKCLEVGMDGYITKPFTLKELFESIGVASKN